ncbi:P-loop containing nucleoside triphosphate hydrolase [Phytophthora cactorum]|nr:P-loop containing nucleoside triphosphate hydrolase [Phytophthora cactorum]
MGREADKENCLETIQRGRDALLNFQAIRARSKASTKLKVVPTPRIALGTIPVINTAPISAPVDQPRQYGENYTGRGRDGADYASSVAGFLPAAAASDVVDLTWTTTPSPSPPMASRTNRGYQNSEAGLQARPAVQQTSYTGMDDDVDSLFDDVDVDALVANHQRAQQQKRRGAPQMSPISEQSFISPPSTQTSGSQETASAMRAEDLRQSIKQTRENLRKVREECDDAFLEGEVPDFMQKRRTELEQELEELSRRYRECKGTTKASPLNRNVSPVQPPPRPMQIPQAYHGGGDSSNKNPTCSCGMPTVEARCHALVLLELTASGVSLNSLSKKDCEQTAEKLIKALGFEHTRKASQISFYHAGLEAGDRAFRHHEWSKGKIKLICATVAFGMGINKPDVRYVIHHTIPQSVTHYYQYFGEHFSSEQCHGTCDNCKNKVLGITFEKSDVTEDCVALAEMSTSELQTQVAKDGTNLVLTLLPCSVVVKSLQGSGDPTTLVQIAQIFLGMVVKGREWKQNQFSQLGGFGKGKGRYSRSEVERILYHMILRQYLREVANAKEVVEVLSDDYDDDVVEVVAPSATTTEYPLIPERISSRRCVLLCGIRVLSAVACTEPKRLHIHHRIPEDHAEALAQILKDWRASVCDSQNLMPYHILTTGGIASIANSVPVSNAELLEIDGVGRIRVKKYGAAIIDIVKTYLAKNNLTPSPVQAARSSSVLDSLEVLDPGVEVVEAPAAPKSSPFFQDKNKRKTSLTSTRPSTTANRNVIDDGLDDIDWDAWDADMLNQTSSNAATNSRKRSLDVSAPRGLPRSEAIDVAAIST